MTEFNPKILCLHCQEQCAVEMPHELASSFSYAHLGDAKSTKHHLSVYQPNLVILDATGAPCDIEGTIKALHGFDTSLPLIILYQSPLPDAVFQAKYTEYIDTLFQPKLLPNQLKHCIERALKAQSLRQQNAFYQSALEKANSELKEYVRLLERDQKAGKQIQTKLLPKAPVTFDSLKIDYKVLPSLYLSGDFIDYGFLDKRFMPFYLCDVSGHGAASAFVTVWLKQRVRRYFYKESYFTHSDKIATDILSLLNRLNEEFLNTGLGSHITGFLGVIDTVSHQLHYIVAGHLPLPILVIEGQAHYLEGKGKPIGIFDVPNWQVYTVDLPKDKAFSLVAFSDGVLEVLPSENLIDKEDYLLKLMSKQPSAISDVTQLLALESLEALPDDIAVLKIDHEINQ